MNLTEEPISYSKTLESLNEAIALNPKEKNLLCRRAQIYVELKQFPEAINDYISALHVEPTCSETHLALARLYDTAGNIGMALSEYFNGFYLNPNQSVKNHFSLGELFLKAGQPKSAVHAFESGLALDPDNIEILISLGATYHNMGLTEKGLKIFRKILSLDPHNGLAYFNFANALTKSALFEEADAAFQKSFELLPHAKAFIYNGRAYHKDRQNNLTAALHDADKALKLEPNLHSARLNRGTFLLKMGRYREGWQDFEARYTKFKWKALLDKPLWRGENPSGRRLLICCDEGYGDTFQMIRYLPLLKQQGAILILLGPISSIEFCKNLPELGVSECSTNIQTPPKFDYWVSILSLPHLFQTELHTIPSLKPAWQFTSSTTEKLPKTNNNFRVGVVWAGNPEHTNNENRSMSLSHLEPLFSLPHISFYSLQCDAHSQDIQMLGFDDHLVNLKPKIKNWRDTAEFLLELDLLITVDTAIAHLSASLEKPTWIMLPFCPDHRWLLDRSDSPWYPSVRLFRQKSPKDWQSVITPIKLAIENREFSSNSKQQQG